MIRLDFCWKSGLVSLNDDCFIKGGNRLKDSEELYDELMILKSLIAKYNNKDINSLITADNCSEAVILIRTLYVVLNQINNERESFR